MEQANSCSCIAACDTSTCDANDKAFIEDFVAGGCDTVTEGDLAEGQQMRCRNGYAEYFDGPIPEAVKGDCHKMYSSADDGPLGEEMKKLEESFSSNFADGDANLEKVVAGTNGLVACYSVNHDGAIKATRGQPRDLKLGFTTRWVAQGFPSIGIVGFYEQGASPVDDKGAVDAKYYKISVQNTMTTFGLAVDYAEDQTEDLRWMGTPEAGSGTIKAEWRASVSGSINEYPLSGNAQASMEYPSTYMIFFMEDWYARTTITRNPSLAAILNMVGGSFAVALAVVALGFREKIAHTDGVNVKVKVFRFKSRKASWKEARGFAKKLFLTQDLGTALEAHTGEVEKAKKPAKKSGITPVPQDATKEDGPETRVTVVSGEDKVGA